MPWVTEDIFIKRFRLEPEAFVLAVLMYSRRPPHTPFAILWLGHLRIATGLPNAKIE